MESRKWNRWSLLLAGVVLLATTTGCPAPAPPAEAVLAGTWELTPATQLDPALEDWTLSFDSNGNLTQIKYKFAGVAQVTLTDPSAATNVDGNNVFISSTIQGTGVQFSGTFNADKTVVDGTLSSNLVVGGITVTIDQGAATLAKLSATPVE